ncbi:hypothetical protein NHX12_025599, partial [Muraenolepis orangiensis]
MQHIGGDGYSVGVVSISELDPRVLQPLWDAMRVHGDLLASPLAPALSALLFHLVLCAPFLALDALGCVCSSVRAHRISGGLKPRVVLRQWSESFWRMLGSYAVGVAPLTAALQYLRTPRLPSLAPTCWRLCVDVLLCLFVFDTLFFIWHYVMH